MKEENIENMIKKSYQFSDISDEIWSRIENSIKNKEKTSNIVEFSNYASIENEIKKSKEEKIVTVNYKSNSRKTYSWAAVAGAAVILLYSLILISNNITKDDNQNITSTGEHINNKVIDTDDTELKMTVNKAINADDLDNILILTGDKVTNYEFNKINWTSYNEEGEKLNESYSINTPFKKMLEDAEKIPAMDPGRWVTIYFENNVPDKVVVTNELYDSNYVRQWENIDEIETQNDIVGNECSFRIEADPRIGFSSNLDYYNQDFYNGYKVECTWGECTGVYMFMVRVNTGKLVN